MWCLETIIRRSERTFPGQTQAERDREIGINYGTHSMTRLPPRRSESDAPVTLAVIPQPKAVSVESN